ncbi:MAG: DUF1636 family protein, partial [Pseudomonadota bacterium]
MADTNDHFMLVCSRCQGADHAAALANDVANRLPTRFRIQLVDCMAGCTRPTTVAFQAAGKTQYLFGDIASPSDLTALVDFAHQYAKTTFREKWIRIYAHAGLKDAKLNQRYIKTVT